MLRLSSSNLATPLGAETHSLNTSDMSYYTPTTVVYLYLPSTYHKCTQRVNGDSLNILYIGACRRHHRGTDTTESER